MLALIDQIDTFLSSGEPVSRIKPLLVALRDQAEALQLRLEALVAELDEVKSNLKREIFEAALMQQTKEEQAALAKRESEAFEKEIAALHAKTSGRRKGKSLRDLGLHRIKVLCAIYCEDGFPFPYGMDELSRLTGVHRVLIENEILGELEDAGWVSVGSDRTVKITPAGELAVVNYRHPDMPRDRTFDA